MNRSSCRLLVLVAIHLSLGGCVTTPAPTPPPAEPLVDAFAIQEVRLFDGQRVWPVATVLVSAGRIVRVTVEATTPPGVPVIDGTGKTLLPGLIDAHTHVWGEEPMQEAATFGVTTLLDMGCADPARGQKLKEQAAAPKSTLADLRFAGYAVTAPGGHCTEYGFPVPTVSSVEDAKTLVDSQVAAGADYIKIVYDDVKVFGFVMPTISKDVLRAAVDAAHANKKLAVVHIGSRQGAHDAIEVGADGLAHTFLDEPPDQAFLNFAVSHGVFVVPTLSVSSSVVGSPAGARLTEDPLLLPYIPDESMKSLRASFGPRRGSTAQYSVGEQSIRALSAAGVHVLAGTDFPNKGTAPGVSIHSELELLVQAGLTPTEALASATSLPAQRFGLSDRGRVQPGLRADLLLIEGDPRTDILATRRIVGVWRGGVAIERHPVERTSAATSNVPEHLGTGLISDFESLTTETQFGSGWSVSTDALYGGKSTAAFKAVSGGAGKTKGSLSITGVVAEGQDLAWAGVLFSPSAKAMGIADLSSKKELVFSAKGDGATYQVLVFSEEKKFAPLSQPFVAGRNWKEYRFPFSAFEGVDGHDIAGIAFVGGPTPGKVQFQLDEVRLQK